MRNLLILVMISVLTAARSEAQTLMPEPFANRSIGLELERPLLESGGLDALSFAGFLYTRLPLGEAYFLAELPFARWGSDGSSAEGIGNVMLGLEGTSGGASLYGTLRLPTASDDASVGIPAIITNFHRVEAWAPDAMALSVGAIWREHGETAGGFDFHLGGVLLKAEDADADIMLDYGVQYVYRPRAFGITGGVQGRAFATGTGNFADRTFHEFRARLDYTSARVRPAIGIRVPLDDDIRDSLNGVLVIGLQVGI